MRAPGAIFGDTGALGNAPLARGLRAARAARAGELRPATRDRRATMTAVPSAETVGGMAATPTVSIVVPAFNQARFLASTLDSVRAQSMTDWECIVVDDGSTDGGAAVAERYVSLDARFALRRQANRGRSHARNTGLDAARGAWVQFLDADDLLDPDKLAKQLAAARADRDVRVVHCDYRELFEGRPPAAERAVRDARASLAALDWHVEPRLSPGNELVDLVVRWASDMIVPCHAFLFDARFFREQAIRFSESLSSAEDWDCWMQVFASHPRTAYVPERLVTYRRHPAATTGDASAVFAGFRQALRGQRARFEGDPLLTRLLLEKERSLHLLALKSRLGLLAPELVARVRRAMRAASR